MKHRQQECVLPVSAVEQPVEQYVRTTLTCVPELLGRSGPNAEARRKTTNRAPSFSSHVPLWQRSAAP